MNLHRGNINVTRKENRPEMPAREESPHPSDTISVTPADRRALRACYARLRARGSRGGTAPFVSRAFTLPLLIIPLFTLLFFSFHPLSSSARAAGEVAPSLSWPARGEVVRSFIPARGSYGAGGHAGIDIALARGSAVRASADGTVSFAGCTPVGRCVSIVHAGGLKTTYVSMEKLEVKRWQAVRRGQVVGTSDGAKDRSSSSPHLHFGLFLNGVAMDPLPFLRGRLLDPGECLFLGPWEDEKAIETFLESRSEGGFFDWLGRGLKKVGNVVASACGKVAGAVGDALGAAWRWTCRAAGALGGAFRAFYRTCIEPWFSPLCRGVVEVFRAIFSNRFVQAVLAGLAAAAIVCLAVAGVALALGVSAVTAAVAAVIGGMAAIGYGIYYAFAAGDSFSFTGCFLGSLTVGAAAAGSYLLFTLIAPLVGTGWSSLGWLGLGKAFLVHGFADSFVYIVFCLSTGREVPPLGLLATFFIGGLTGSVGKLFITGLTSGGAAQALAAGWISSGGALLTAEGAASLTAYAGAFIYRFTFKTAYVLFCGCTAFLGDVVIRAASGVCPSITESLLCFFGGGLAGGLSLTGGGEGLAGLIARLSGGRLKITSDLARALMGKSLSKGLKEGARGLLDLLRRRDRSAGKSAWLLNTGGELE